MTALIDQYPAMQTVSGPPIEQEVLRAALLPEKMAKITTAPAADLLNPSSETGDPIEVFQPDKQAEATSGSAGDS